MLSPRSASAAATTRNSWRALAAICTSWTSPRACWTRQWRKLRQAGLEDRIAGRHHLSGARLEGLPSESVDLALLMGPLYHLQSLAERQRSVQESARILKPGGTLFAAGINRLSYLRDLLRLNFGPVSERVAFHQQYLRDGNLDPEHAPPIGYAHLTTADGFPGAVRGPIREGGVPGR